MADDIVTEKMNTMPKLKQEKNKLTATGMSVETFDLFSEYIQQELGIKMQRNKQVMLQARLMKRLRKLGMNSYEEYYNYLFSDDGHYSELPHFVHEVTTNKTDFFRESIHFNFMHEVMLPDYVKSGKSNKTLKVWSAGRPSGEEPYSIAMSISEFSETSKTIDYKILATDSSTASGITAS